MSERSYVVILPLQTGYASEMGEVTERLLHYYKIRSGMQGAIQIVERTYVGEQAPPRQLRIGETRYQPGLTVLAATIRGGLALPVLQLEVSPKADRETSELLMAEACQKAFEAGFFGVEWWAGKQSLFWQQFTPGKLLSEQVALLRLAVSIARRQFPKGFVSLRLPFELPYVLARDRLVLWQWFRQDGLTVLNPEVKLADHTEPFEPQGDLPVVQLGGIHTLDSYQRVKESGARYIGLGRALLADPLFLQKAQEPDTITPCIHCYACLPTATDRELGCLVRPESSINLEKTSRRKSWLVVGSGLPGLFFAKALKLKGHDVTVSSYGHLLGGGFGFRAQVAGNPSFAPFLQQLVAELKRLGVRMETEPVAPESYDAVASSLASPPIAFQGSLSWQEVVSESDQLGTSINILGSGLLAGETAAYLSDRGLAIRVIMEERVAFMDSYAMLAERLLQRLSRRGVPVLTSRSIDAWKNGALWVSSLGRLREVLAAEAVLDVRKWVTTELVFPHLELGDPYTPLPLRQAVERAWMLGGEQ